MAAATAGDWALLPSELLGSIAKRLTVTDYIRFGAVCCSWRSITSPPRDPLFLPQAPQMPWLLFSVHEGDPGGSSTIVTLSDRRCRRFSLHPEMLGKWFVGSRDGWLALIDEQSEVSLFNPLAGSQIHLPSVSTMPNFRNRDRRRFKKIVWASGPTACSYTAIAIYSGFPCKTTFSTADCREWTFLTTAPAFNDIIYHGNDGNFLAVSSDSGELWSLEITADSSPRLTMIAKGCGFHRSYDDKYLVYSSGDILLVWKGESETFKVMRFEAELAAWVPLKSLGDCSLFLGSNHSIFISAREVSDLKRNCIYFSGEICEWDTPSDDEDSSRCETMVFRDYVGVFNLEDGSFDRYYPPWNLPHPLWFAPTLL